MPREPLRIQVTAPPTRELMNMGEARQYLRIEEDETEDDAVIAAMLRAAQERCETYTGRALLSRQYRLYLDRWPGQASPAYWEGWRTGYQGDLDGPVKAWVDLPRPPLVSVETVTTYDDSDAGQVWPATSYYVDTASVPGRIVKRKGQTWPTADRAANAIEIDYTAGYGVDPSQVPEALRNGVLAMLAWLYEHRGEELDAAKASASSGAEIQWAPYVVRHT